MLFTKKYTNTLKYNLVTAEPHFTVKTIDWMHKTGPRILLFVTYMLYVNQVYHGVGSCVKDGSCSSSSLSESQWTVLIGYLTISTNVVCRCYQTHYRWQFFIQEDSALVHCACSSQLLQRSRLIQHLSEKRDFRVIPFARWVSELEFNVPFQHKDGYIRDDLFAR